MTLNEIGREYANLYYGDARMIAYFVGIAIDAIIGVILILSSFAKPTDEQCFIHGQKWLEQVARDRAYFYGNKKEE